MKLNFALACFLGVISSTSSAEIYNYIDYSVPDKFENGQTLLTLDLNSKQMASSDVVVTVSVCNDTSKYYCFSYPSTSFFVPKEKISQGQKWLAGGLLFKVLRKESIRAFGLTKNVWLIMTERLDGRDYFYYSEFDGLLAMKYVDKEDGQVHFFIVSGEKGFPR